jgi:hypothetical protein
MQIVLERGVDDIVFGMTEAELVALLGEPDKVESDSEYGITRLFYYKRKLILNIEDSNDSRLGWLEVHNHQSRWLGLSPWTLAPDILLARLGHYLHDTYAVDDYGGMESYNFDRYWLELQYVLGDLSAFNFGVTYGADDRPLWPPR